MKDGGFHGGGGQRRHVSYYSSASSARLEGLAIAILALLVLGAGARPPAAPSRAPRKPRGERWRGLESTRLSTKNGYYDPRTQVGIPTQVPSTLPKYPVPWQPCAAGDALHGIRNTHDRPTINSYDDSG